MDDKLNNRQRYKANSKGKQMIQHTGEIDRLIDTGNRPTEKTNRQASNI